MKRIIYDHLRQYWIIYLTLSCVFLAGAIFGAIGVGALGAEKSAELSTFFNSLLQQQPKTIDPNFLQLLARDYFIIMAGIWLLGLTIIGTPLVYLIVFVRGFVLGFTVVFILTVKKVVGLGLVLLTILCPSLLAVPCLLLAAGMATIFSFLLLQSKNHGNVFRKDFLYYCASSLLVSFGAVAAAVLQGYFSLVGVRFLGL